MKEIWEDIKDFENYQVSTLGRVRKKDCLIMIGGFPRRHKMTRTE